MISSGVRDRINAWACSGNPTDQPKTNTPSMPVAFERIGLGSVGIARYLVSSFEKSISGTTSFGVSFGIAPIEKNAGKCLSAGYSNHSVIVTGNLEPTDCRLRSAYEPRDADVSKNRSTSSSQTINLTPNMLR